MEDTCAQMHKHMHTRLQRTQKEWLLCHSIRPHIRPRLSYVARATLRHRKQQQQRHTPTCASDVPLRPSGKIACKGGGGAAAVAAAGMLAPAAAPAGAGAAARAGGAAGT